MRATATGFTEAVGGNLTSETPGPRLDDEGFCLPNTEAYEAQQQALSDLEHYPVRVVERTLHDDLGETSYARFTQERVRFSDGAVRLLSRAEPKRRYFGKEHISPFPISDGDALFTGPNGVNNDLLDAYAKLGYPVEWLHHQGRHTLLPLSRKRMLTMMHFLSTKSVGRSAHHDHALFDDLDRRTGIAYDTSEVLRDGFSRSAMSGEAFVALAPLYKRAVLYSDLTAKCFAEGYDTLGNAKAMVRQGPKEALGLGRLVQETMRRELAGERGAVLKMVGTFDIHPLNVAHEIAWIRPLINGDSGVYSRAIPLETVGVRGFLTQDDMSQYAAHLLIHASHPNLALVQDEGTHVEGVTQEMLRKKVERFSRVMDFMKAHDMTLSGLQPTDFLEPTQDYWIAGQDYLVAA